MGRTRSAVLGLLALVASTGVSVAAPPSASAADTRIAYQCRTPNDICTVTPSGTGGVRLLNDSAVDTAPAWSPDGRQIAFFRSVLSDTTQSGVFVMNADGSGLRRVAPAPNVSGVSWSPDGTRIAFGKHPDIYVARTDGTGLTRLTNYQDPASGNGTSPAWSPDGRKIAYYSTKDGYGCRVADGSLHLTYGAVYTMNPDGTGKTRVTPAQDPARGYVDGFSNPDWTPGSSDPSRMAYSRDRQSVTVIGGEAICGSVRKDDLMVDGVVRTTGDYPSFSPDGLRIAFYRSADDGVYVANRDGSAATRIATGSFPAWQVPSSAPKPACSDGVDNDADGKTDYPADPGCSSATDTGERGAQLLRNPGFETDANVDGRPDSWTSNAKFTRSSTLKLSGSYSGRHYATDNTGHTITQTVPSLTAGRSYRFAGSVNIPVTSDAFTYAVQIRWRNSTGTTISTTTLRSFTAATAGWVPVAATRTAPLGTTSASVALVASSLNARVHVDSFTLQIA